MVGLPLAGKLSALTMQRLKVAKASDAVLWPDLTSIQRFLAGGMLESLHIAYAELLTGQLLQPVLQYQPAWFSYMRVQSALDSRCQRPLLAQHVARHPFLRFYPLFHPLIAELTAVQRQPPQAALVQLPQRHSLDWLPAGLLCLAQTKLCKGRDVCVLDRPWCCQHALLWLLGESAISRMPFLIL